MDLTPYGDSSRRLLLLLGTLNNAITILLRRPEGCGIKFFTFLTLSPIDN